MAAVSALSPTAPGSLCKTAPGLQMASGCWPGAMGKRPSWTRAGKHRLRSLSKPPPSIQSPVFFAAPGRPDRTALRPLVIFGPTRPMRSLSIPPKTASWSALVLKGPPPFGRLPGTPPKCTAVCCSPTAQVAFFMIEPQDRGPDLLGRAERGARLGAFTQWHVPLRKPEDSRRGPLARTPSEIAVFLFSPRTGQRGSPLAA